MAANADPEEVLARFEELSVLEAEFEDVELELSKTPSLFLRQFPAETV